ncbi:hypothetical protein B484DRAFT_484875, partial [Ochromonadaceae sp. CCMP2298]
MEVIYPTEGQHAHHLHESLRHVDCELYLDNHPKGLHRLIATINEAMRIHEPEIIAAAAAGKRRTLEIKVVKILLNRIIAGKTDTTRQPVTVRARLKILCTKDGLPETVADLIDRLISKSEYLVRACKEASECGYTIHRIGKSDVDGDVVRTKESARLAREARSKDREIRGKICTSCGMDNHEVADCRLKHHPHANKSAKPFKESFHGLRYVAAGKSQLKYAEDGTETRRLTGAYCDTNTIHPDTHLQVETLLDTGAVMGNYCSTR